MYLKPIVDMNSILCFTKTTTPVSTQWPEGKICKDQTLLSHSGEVAQPAHSGSTDGVRKDKPALTLVPSLSSFSFLYSYS